VPRVASVIRGSKRPASIYRSAGDGRRKHVVTNPAWLDFGPTRALSTAQARLSATRKQEIADLKQQEAEKKGREATEERDALVESLLLDDPQTFIDRKWPHAVVNKAVLHGAVDKDLKPELLKMLGPQRAARSKAEKSLKRSPATNRKLVDYGVRKGYFERDPLEIAIAKAKASGKKGSGVSSLGPKVSEYNTAINAYAKKYKVKAGLGLSVNEDGDVQMDMDAFTRGEQTFYEVMQGISDGTITGRKIAQDEAARDLTNVRAFYQKMNERLLADDNPILKMPGTIAPPGVTTRQAGATPSFTDMTPEQRRGDPTYQAYRAARHSGATHEEALSAMQGAPPAAPAPAAPGIPAQPRGATQATPNLPATPDGQSSSLPQDPGAVSSMIDEMMAGAGLAANTPIDVGGGDSVTLAEVAEVVKKNVELIPGFLLEFFIKNPIEGAKQIISMIAEGSNQPGLPAGLS
jgi:hypothetical protein